MNNPLKTLTATLLAWAWCTTPVLAGSILYGVNYAGTTPLYTIDQTSGAAISVGGALVDIGDLTSNQVDTLWGVTLPPSGGTGVNDLVSIDPLTGAVLSSVALTGTRAGNITSLAYNPLSAKLYGNTTPFYGDPDGDRLYEIDPLTGSVALIGEIGFEEIYALAFDQLGTLFGISNGGTLLSIDTGTGAGTSIAAGLGGGLFDMASRPEDNVMFLTVGFGSLGTIDTTTGVIDTRGGYGGPGNVVGLAFLGERVIPEPATLALCGMGLLAWGLRGRPRAAAAA